jgi:hypothetical protein
MSAKIATALHEIMGKVGYVQKTGKNAFHGYKYAGEADLLDKLRPAMLEAGLILLPSVDEVRGPDEHGNTTVRVGYTLMHKDGDVWPDKIYAAGCGGDKANNGKIGDKGVYKAITGANKYLLFKLFQIETGDDPESETAADDKESDRAAPAPKQAKPAVPTPTPSPAGTDKTADMLIEALKLAKSVDDLNKWGNSDATQVQIGDLSTMEAARVRAAWKLHKDKLMQSVAA